METAYQSWLPMRDDHVCDITASPDLDGNDTLDLDEVLRKEDEDLAFCALLTFPSLEIENRERTTHDSEQDSDVEPVLPAIELRYGNVVHDLIVLSSEASRTERDAQESWIRGQDLFANEWFLLEQPLSELFALVRQEMRLTSPDAEAGAHEFHMTFESIEGSFISESDALTSVLTLMDLLSIYIEAAGMQERDISLDPFRIELGITGKYYNDVSQEAATAEDTATDRTAEKDAPTDDSRKTAIVPEDSVQHKVEISEWTLSLDCDNTTSACCQFSISLNDEAGVGLETGSDKVFNVDDMSLNDPLKQADIGLERSATPLGCGCRQCPPKRHASDLTDLLSGEAVYSFWPKREHKKNRTGSFSGQEV
ncbi:unnamed protein product [Mortierella alpina]